MSPLDFSTAHSAAAAAENAQNGRLISAVRTGDVGSARSLLQLGAEINTIDGDTGYSALCLASSLGNVELCKLFLGCGADPRMAVPEAAGKNAIAVASNQVVRDVLDSHEPGRPPPPPPGSPTGRLRASPPGAPPPPHRAAARQTTRSAAG